MMWVERCWQQMYAACHVTHMASRSMLAPTCAWLRVDETATVHGLGRVARRKSADAGADPMDRDPLITHGALQVRADIALRCTVGIISADRWPGLCCFQDASTTRIEACAMIPGM